MGIVHEDVVKADEGVINRAIHECNLFKELIDRHGIGNIESQDIGSGKGHLSTVYKVQINFRDKDIRPIKLVAKLPSVEVVKTLADKDESELEEDANMISFCHNQECVFYNMFKGLGLAIPKAYHSKITDDLIGDPAFILMNSLADSAVTVEVGAPVNAAQCLNVARELARIQAAANKIPGKPWSKFSDSFRVPSKIEATYERYAPILRDYDSKTFGPLLDKLKPHLTFEFLDFALKKRSQQLGTCALTHGDLHGNNLLFEKTPEGTMGNKLAAILDWQLCSPGNPMFDLARFMMVSTEADLRRSMHEQLVDAYLEELKVHSSNSVMSREECLELFELALAAEGTEMVVLCPVFQINHGKPEHVQEALNQRYALRTKLGLEDALHFVEKWKWSF